MTALVINVPEAAVVRLPDGRVGRLTHHGGRRSRHAVITADNLGIPVGVQDEVTVVRTPHQLAADYVTAHVADGRPVTAQRDTDPPGDS